MTTGHRYDLTLVQGASFEQQVTLTDITGGAVNLSGYTGYAPFRSRFGASGLGEFTITDSSPELGIFTLSLTNLQTSGLPCTQGRYELEMASGDYAAKYLNGIVSIYPEL